MSRAKTAHRIRRDKNARTGNQILLRKIGIAYGRAAARITCERIEMQLQQIRAAAQAWRDFTKALYRMAEGAAQVAQGIRKAWGAQ